MLDFVYNWPVPLQLVAFIVALVIGVFFLVKFCDIFVDAASDIAKKLKISAMIIGLTIVAMGTSCPELAVSASDSISCLGTNSNANVAMGNVVGSNIANILLVLGFACVFTTIPVKKETLKRDYPFLIFVSVLLVVFGIFFGIGSATGNYAILRWEAIIFVVLMIAYIVYLVIDAKKHPQIEEEAKEEIEGEIKELKKEKKLWLLIVLVLVGAAGVVIGGEAVVFGAKGIALLASDAMGLDHDLSEALIGLTIVAVGTSLPELVTSTIAAKKGEVDLAIGNVIGSNIFNVLFVLGIAATINPITTGGQIVFDLLFMLFVTLLLVGLSFRKKLDRITGIIFLSLYVLYTVYLILRTVGVIPAF